MSQILDQFGASIAEIFDHPIVHLAVQGVAVYAVALWLAAAYWAFRDMRCRTVNPILPYLAASAVILFSPVLFPLAVLAYRIVRPQETISEAWERHLAEEAMRAELDATTCGGCGRRVDEEWLACPACGTRLSRRCLDCGRAVALDWILCAWCGREFRTGVVERVPVALAASEVTSVGPGRGSPPAADVDEERTVAVPIFGGRSRRPAGLFGRGADRRHGRDGSADVDETAAAIADHA